MHYTFTVVRLWEIPQERVLDTEHYVLWPLASLMAGASAERTVAVAERLAAIPVPRRQRSDLIGLLVGLAGIATARDAILSLLRSNPMLDDLLKESSVAEAFIEEGIEEGERRMARRMIRIVLEGCFGQLSDDLLTALNAADEAVLEQIGTHAGTDTLEQIRARLGLQ